MASTYTKDFSWKKDPKSSNIEEKNSKLPNSRKW
jgi:hypothetical protein